MKKEIQTNKKGNPWDHLPDAPLYSDNKQSKGNPWDHLPDAPMAPSVNAPEKSFKEKMKEKWKENKKDNRSVGEIWKDGQHNRELATQKMGDKLQAFAPTVKSAVAGYAGGTVDAVVGLPYNLLTLAFNALKNSDYNKQLTDEERQQLEALSGGEFAMAPSTAPDISTAPSAVETIDKGIDNLTNDYTKTPESQKHLQEGIKAAASTLSAGGLAKKAIAMGAKGVGKALNAFGSTKPLNVISAGVGSAQTSKALDEGKSFGNALLHGMLDAQLPFLAKDIAKKVVQGGFRSVGAGASNFKNNWNAINTAEKMGIELPMSVASDSKLVSLGNQYVAKAPYLGVKLAQKNERFITPLKENVEKIAESIGQQRTPEFQEFISNLYGESQKLLTPKDVIAPNNLVKAALDLKKDLSLTTIVSPETEEALKWIDKVLKGNTFNGKKAVPTEVERLVNTKINLNNIINWETPNGVKKTLRRLSHAVKKDLEEAGKTNNDWWQKFQEADKTAAKSFKRERYDRIFEGVVNEKDVYGFNHNKFVDKFDKNKDRLKKDLSGEDFQTLENTAKLSKAWIKSLKNNPNPSGTATVLGVKDLMGGILTLTTGSIFPAATGASVWAAGTAHGVLTNKTFYKLAIRFARKQNETNARNLMDNFKELVNQHALPIPHSLVTFINHDNETKNKLKIEISKKKIDEAERRRKIIEGEL